MQSRILNVCLAAMLCLPGAARGQESALRQAASRIQGAWMSHDVGSLLEGESFTLRLRGSDEEAGSVPRTQAARILARYLRPASEEAFDIRTVRVAGSGQGYAEASRRYVVRGTSDPVSETVLLGFRLTGGRWQLTEIRVTP